MEELRLFSPVGAGREYDLVYNWPTEESGEKYTEEDLAEEIRDTFASVLPDHPQINFRIPPITALYSYDKLKELIDKWNAAVVDYTNGREFVDTKASLPQAQHIIGQVYNKSVVCPERLNQYTAFSSHVYGETSPKMVSHMIKQLRITSDDVFLDLGSGVGQVVLQMAAAADFKVCVGIETCEVPCEYAVGLENEFRRTMKWYGKLYSKFHLYKGDFLDKPYRDVILKSSIIFANNFAFGPEVDHRLKEIFADLDDGVRIVSSKEFSTPNFRINQRNLSDIGTIMHVSPMKPFEGAVSWTNSKVSFFLHVIDRTKLEKYFLEGKQSFEHPLIPTTTTKCRQSRPSKLLDDKRTKKRRNNVERRFKRKRPRIETKLPPVLEPAISPIVENTVDVKASPPVLSTQFTANDTFVKPSKKRAPIRQTDDPYVNAPWRNVQMTVGSPKSVDELLARMRVQYFAMLDKMRSQNYVVKIVEELRLEKERNALLRNRRDKMNNIVDQLLSNGVQLLTSRLRELGIDKDNWETLFSELGQLVEEQASLSVQKASLRREIAALERKAESLTKCRVVDEIVEAFKTKRHLRKTVCKLTGELHEIEGKTPPSFPDSPESECEFSTDPTTNRLTFFDNRRVYVNGVQNGETFDNEEEELPTNIKRELPSPPPPILRPAVSPPPPPLLNGSCHSGAPVVSNMYKMKPSSILPKKRR